MISAEGVRVSVTDRRGGSFDVLALDHFQPKEGALTVVAGPSGCGKSTLLYLLAGLMPPSAGRVLAGEVDIYRLSESRRDAWRRRTIGFVFQDFHLVPELSALGNVTLPATFGRGGGKVHARAEALLQRLGVPLDRRSIDVLSRGERQRLAVARALAYDPPILLADEPTASLDEAAGGEVRAILLELAGEGRTVIAATHDPGLIEAAGDRLRLDHGSVVPAGGSGR